MAASVLGKRQRNAIDLTGVSLLRRPNKRQAKALLIHDENDDPFISSPTQDGPQPMAIDGPQQENETPAKRSTAGTVPAKYTVRDGRVVLSPTKINSHFKPSQNVLDENANPVQVATPKNSRYRDALSKAVPITPRHRVSIVGKPLTPRTPRTPSTPGTTHTIYTTARQLFVRSATLGRLIGRDNERDELKSFIQHGIGSRLGDCMYVSGPPGTGKSALIEEICRDLGEENILKLANVNCVSMKSSKGIYGKLIEDLCIDTDLTKKNETELLRDIFVPKKKSRGDIYLVTLDEIDHLLIADLEILYSLFEWSLSRNSHLILIGIANALDLTDRFLPRLKARNLKPKLLPFLPYTAPQIASVITTRLQSLLADSSTSPPNYVPFLHPAAIQLCSKKVASQTGDLRKAFDIVRRSIDLIERETKEKHQPTQPLNLQWSPSKTPLMDNMNLSSPPTPPKTPSSSPKLPSLASSSSTSLATLTPETAPRASIAHIARITSAAFGNSTTQRLSILNLQQKAALCSLVAIEKKKRLSLKTDIFATPSKTANSAPTVKQLFESYCGLCKRDNVLHPLTATEFRDVVSSLETFGLVGEVDGRKGTFLSSTPSRKGWGRGVLVYKRIASCVSEREVESIVGGGAGEGILRSLLGGEGL